MLKIGKRTKRVVRTLFAGDQWGTALGVMCGRFKKVTMHERDSGKTHTLLYQVDFIPTVDAIKTTIAEAYGIRKSDIIIDDIAKHRRKKDEPLKPPTPESIAKNAQFASYSERRAGDVVYQLGDSDTVRCKRPDCPRKAGK